MRKQIKNRKIKIILASAINFVLCVSLAYTVTVSNIPNNIILLQGESLQNNSLLGLNFMDTEEASSSLNEKLEVGEVTGKTEAKLVAFGKISLKEVDVTVVPKTKVVPLRKYNRS